jgi:hypothetical protein
MVVIYYSILMFELSYFAWIFQAMTRFVLIVNFINNDSEEMDNIPFVVVLEVLQLTFL